MEHGVAGGGRATGWLVGVLAWFLLLTALALSPYRYFLLPLALVVVMAFGRLKNPVLGLLTLIPYAPLLNLEGFLTDTSLYPSEVVLLSAVGTTALRRPQAVRFEGAAWLALGFGAWMVLAAFMGTGLADTARIARLLRTGVLAATLFAIARESVRQPGGLMSWIDAATGAAGIFAFLALGEAAFHLGSGVTGIPRTGSAVGGEELLAIHLTLLAPPGFALMALGRDRSRATGVLLLLAAMALVISFSRSGWLGGWAAILGMGLLLGNIDRGMSRRLVFTAVGILVVGGAGALLGASLPGALAEYAARLRSIASPAVLVAARAHDWGEGMAALAARPLFGHPDAGNPYNIALGLAVVSGLPALAFFLGLAAASAWSGLRALARPHEVAPAVGLLGSLIALWVTGMGEASLGARVTPAAFATLGCLSGLGSRRGGAQES